MIEVLFNDSAAGALACAKEDGDGTSGGTEVVITADQNGNMTSEPWEPEPYSGPTIEGSPSDIVLIWLMADIGDISNLPDSRKNLLQKMDEIYAGEDDWKDDVNWPAEAIIRMYAEADRLREAAKAGEHVRIWWSDAVGEVCGFYWVMEILKGSAGPVSSIKIPVSAEELTPERFVQLLSSEQSIESTRRRSLALEWKKLSAENAPLRAMVNGPLCSVPIDFYDYVLRGVISEGESRVISIIGQAMIKGPDGISDWWYAGRLKEMIAAGELKVVEKNKTFYTSIIKSVV